MTGREGSMSKNRGQENMRQVMSTRRSLLNMEGREYE